jgi:hypothetical protein
VLYLGRPVASVVIEAYRHLIDPVEVDDEAARMSLIDNLVPRVLITCDVSVTRLLDLRTAGARAQANLTIQDLHSPTNDRDAYKRCQQVAAIAHQLGRHGIITPAATRQGETLPCSPICSRKRSARVEAPPTRRGTVCPWTRDSRERRSCVS